ncbi:MAG: diguanylate cyclase [bacterium]|nr:diguanylate cyclase [bacterium]
MDDSNNKQTKQGSDFPVLVVEDNPISCKLLTRKLVVSGYTVVSASNGREALEILKDRFFSLILTDWMMPEMNGLELCRALRERENEGYIFIVLLTARDTTEDIIMGLEAGADDYLTKPVNHSELIARLNSGKRILALEKNLKEANEKIHLLSITDPLTGCFNRGYMTKKLTQELKRGCRYNRPLSLIFCDIDHFKGVNDTYGHQAGDHILKEFTKCLLENIRVDVDWLTRYGGEEFLIVLPETDPQGAFCVAERIRESVEKREIKWEGLVIPITSSFGVTGMDGSGDPADFPSEAMIRQADKALYQSKHDGRNRVTMASFPD